MVVPGSYTSVDDVRLPEQNEYPLVSFCNENDVLPYPITINQALNTSTMDAHIGSPGVAQTSVQSARYPHSLLEQRKQRQFHISDFEVQPKPIGTGLFGT
jgi:hypothetical protein